MGTESGPQRLIGREQELGTLWNFIGGSEGVSSLVIEGPPGIGKSSLFRAAVPRLREQQFQVLQAQPVEPEAELAFATLGDLLTQVVDELGSLPAPQRKALRVALLLEESRGSAPDQRAVGAALLGLLERLSEQRRVAVAIDDLHWTDRASAAALGFALRRLHDPRVLFLGTRRTSDEALPDPDRTARIEVGPLDARPLGKLLTEQLGPRLPKPMLDKIAEVSGGNPFYALELGRALLQRPEPAAVAEPLPIPGNLHALVAQRLEQLSAPTRQVLVGVALLANPAASIVRQLGENVDRSLAEAERAGVVAREAGKVRFTHPLLASVLAAEAEPEELRELNARLAELVADREARAFHLSRSVVGVDESVAAELDRAAAGAARRGALVAAAELAERAMTFTDAADPEFQERARRAGALAFDVGSAGHARDLLERALARPADRRERARTLLELARVRAHLEGPEVADRLYDRALAEASGDRELAAKVHVLAAHSESSKGFAAREAHVLAAVELADPVSAPALAAEALTAAATIRFFAGKTLDRQSLDRAIALAAASDAELWLDTSPTMVKAALLVRADELADAEPLLLELDRRATAAGDASHEVVLCELSQLELKRGNWQRARDLADAAHDLVIQAGRDSETALTLVCRGEAVMFGGHLDDARSTAERALAIAQHLEQPVRVENSRRILGFVHLALGDADRARAELAEGIELKRALEIGEPTSYLALPDLIEALVRLDRLEEAAREADWLHERSRAVGRAWGLAAAARGRGLIAAAKRDFDDAARHFNEALQQHARSPNPFEEARTLVALGTSERRARRKAAARQALSRALAIYDRLETEFWPDLVQRELSHIGGRPARAGALTPTEQRIADLVVAGKSNAEVANALFLSPKTVEWNLSKVYKKLHVATRTELAAKLAKR